MEAEERTEVRNIIHDILEGWQEATVQREKATIARENLIHQSLNSIDTHLQKLNGSVAEHTFAITDLKRKDDLHIVDCPVMPLVKKLDKEVETLKIEAFTVWIRQHWKLSIFLSVLSLYIIYNLFAVLSLKELINLIK